MSKMIKAACMSFSTNLKLFKVIHCACITLDSYIFDSIFTVVANTTSTPIGWEGDG